MEGLGGSMTAVAAAVAAASSADSDLHYGHPPNCSCAAWWPAFAIAATVASEVAASASAAASS